MHVSPRFERRLSALQRVGVLQEIRPESLPRHIVKEVGPLRSVNLLVLSCCDGHQFMDITQRTKMCCEEMKRQLGATECADDCFHWKTVHGGPFVLSDPRLRVQQYRGEQEYTERHVLREIEEGMSLKSLNVVLLIGHIVCGKVRDIFESPEEYAENMVRAKEHVMEHFGLPKAQVISWLQGHREKGRRMYHVDYKKAAALAA